MNFTTYFPSLLALCMIGMGGAGCGVPEEGTPQYSGVYELKSVSYEVPALRGQGLSEEEFNEKSKEMIGGKFDPPKSIYLVHRMQWDASLRRINHYLGFQGQPSETSEAGSHAWASIYELMESKTKINEKNTEIGTRFRLPKWFDYSAGSRCRIEEYIYLAALTSLSPPPALLEAAYITTTDQGEWKGPPVGGHEEGKGYTWVSSTSEIRVSKTGEEAWYQAVLDKKKSFKLVLKKKMVGEIDGCEWVGGFPEGVLDDDLGTVTFNYELAKDGDDSGRDLTREAVHEAKDGGQTDLFEDLVHFE